MQLITAQSHHPQRWAQLHLILQPQKPLTVQGWPLLPLSLYYTFYCSHWKWHSVLVHCPGVSSMKNIILPPSLPREVEMDMDINP